MARPKKNQEGPSAQERIEQAFWTLLDRNGYEGITVSALSRTANVSPNTFYYHYDNIEAVARKAFGENLIRDIPRFILEGRHEKLDAVISENKDSLAQRARRIALFAASESGILRTIVLESFTRIWMDTIGIDEADLSEEERLSVDFIAHGIVSVLARASTLDLARIYPAFLESSLGQGAIAEMRAIERRHSKSQNA
ncbi:MAG: TetR/AcrR family transcriptional regulator [Slackia sp.]|nr:TetR/AcrR family transcriptional regulator [Slackia sp.]